MVNIRPCTHQEIVDNYLSLVKQIWSVPESDMSVPIIASLFGGVTLGAFDGPKMIGYSIAIPIFVARQPAWFSYGTGVLPEYRGQNIGTRLKQEQKAAAKAVGIKTIWSTFDPDSKVNTRFHLEKLKVNFDRMIKAMYGPGHDRVLTYWDTQDATLEHQEELKYKALRNLGVDRLCHPVIHHYDTENKDCDTCMYLKTLEDYEQNWAAETET